MRRSRESDPYRASASTQAQGAPASSAWAINSQAICGLVAKATSSGTPALARLLSSWAQASGRAYASVDQSLPVAAGIGQEHANLAVLDPPRRARILARDPDRVLALLQEPGLVDHQHAVPIAEGLDHVSADAIAPAIRLPAAAPQQRLHAVGALKPGLLGQKPACLGPDPGQQAIEKGSGGRPYFGPAEHRSDPLLERRQFAFPRHQRPRPDRNRHRRSSPPTRAQERTTPAA